MKTSLNFIFAFILALSLGAFPMSVSAISKYEIDSGAELTLHALSKQVKTADDLIAKAKGVLVFPEVYKAGIFFFGGGYGEGSLLIDGKNADYYSVASGAFGWQLGAQKRSMIFLFMEDDALNKLRTSSNWKAGVDASVTVIDVGADGSIDSQLLNKPIIAFVIGQKGLMCNLTLEGTKFTKLDKKY